MPTRLHRIHPIILARAREMRHPLTRAEALLWARIRDRQLGGFKFRRQHPIDRFIVDFYCPEHRLIIEVDGPSHTSPEQIEYDKARTEWLNDNGYQLIRFWNEQVYDSIEPVLESILNRCATRRS